METTRPWEDTVDPTEISKDDKEKWYQIDPLGHIETAGYWLICAPEQIAWHYNAVYTGHSLNMKEGEWLLVMRALFKGKKKVCFTRGARPIACVRSFAWDVKCGRVKWYDDLY